MNTIPYSCQTIEDEDIEAVCSALRSKFITQGPTISAFEGAFGKRHGVSHAVAVSSATAGLHIACLALGVGPGSRVWTSPNSFVASANCALYCGAEVDFVDIDLRTRNMSVDALEDKLIRAKATSGLPDVVIPVDFAGMPCDLKSMRELADRYGFKILEDASHAIGATYRGKPIGSEFSDVVVFSLHAVKIITTGEGGMVATQEKDIAQRLRLLRSHGISRSAADLGVDAAGWYYEQRSLGFNYRLTDVQAALGLSQLARLDRMRARREELAGRYDDLLSALPLILPIRSADRRSSWHLYVIEIDERQTSKLRAEVYRELNKAGIELNVHYIPIHLHPYYARLGFSRGDFPASEKYYERALSIPLFPRLTEAQQDTVVRHLAAAVE